MEEKTVVDLLTELNRKMDMVVAILSIAGKSQPDQILILRELGHDWKLIGKLTGMTPDGARMKAKRK